MPHWLRPIQHRKELNMSTDQSQQTSTQPQQSDQQQGGATASPPQDAAPAAHGGQPPEDFDGLEGKKPDELTPEELRLMADTMPGEGPGD
jgi:hypothetical protein